MSAESENRKLVDLRVVDLRSELEKRGIDKTGVKSLLIERLEKALRDEGHDPEEYLFNISEKKTPVKRLSKRGEQDGETESNADENHDQGLDVDDDDEPEIILVKEEPGKETADASEQEAVTEMKAENPEPAKLDSEKESSKDEGEDAAKVEIKTEASASPEKPAGSEQQAAEKITSAADGDKNVPEANGVDNEDSINLTIGEDDEKLLAEEEDSSHEKDVKDEGSLHKKDEAAGAQDKSNDEQASAGEDKLIKADEQAASEDKAGADKNKSVSQVSGDQKALKDDKDKKKVPGVPAGSSRNLWVSGLSSSTRATDLKQVFSKYGKVIGAKVVTNARTPGARCYGYVTMASSEDATKCIQHLHRTELHGRMISVERAKGDSTGPPKKTENKVPIVKKVEEKKRHERKLSTGSKVEEKKEEEKTAPEQASKEEPKPDVKPGAKVEEKNEVENEEGATSVKEEEKATVPAEKRDLPRDRERHRSAGSSHHSRPHSNSPHRGGLGQRQSPARRPGVLTFAQIREARERQRMREREREMREEDRRRREEFARQREIERRNKEEAMRLEREKEKLRFERERIERERAELLRLERERQKLEREKLEREREELKRQQMRLEEARRSTKRPAEERRETYPEDRKRVATDRRYETTGRFEERSESFANKKNPKPGTDFNRHGASKLVNSNLDESRSSRRERDTLVGRTGDQPRREHVSPGTGRGKERFERPPAFRSRDEHRGESDHRSKMEIRSRDRYQDAGKGEGRYTDRSGDTWHSGGGPAPPKPFSSAPSTRDTWQIDRDRKGDSSQNWGRPMESSGSDRWVSGSGGPMSVVSRGPAMGNPNMYAGPQGASPSMPGMGLGMGASPYSGDRFDAYKQSMPLRKY